MSFNFTVEQFNKSFERIALWYRQFMQRTEQGFIALHQRVTYLEEHQPWQGPSDEQVERVLRKILAERFADHVIERDDTSGAMKDRADFKLPHQDPRIPNAIPIDVNSLQVDPKAMPSQTYADTLRMLEDKLPGFPPVDLSRAAQDDQIADAEDTKDPRVQPKRSKQQLWS